MGSTDAVRSPAVAPDRHTLVDALRGLALLGILVVNVEFIVQPSEIGWLANDSTVDRIVRWFVVAFGQTKVYPLFALLFGYGLAIQMANAERRGTALGPRYRRRTIGLAVLGVIHGVLFFPGDILVIYAVIGALAYRARHLDTRRLLRLGAVIYASAAVLWLLLGAVEVVVGAADPSAPADAVAILTSGSWPEVVALHFWYWLATLGILALVQGPAVLACFLVGVAMGRTDTLARPGDHLALARRARRLAPLGVLGAGIGALLVLAGGRFATLGFAVGFAVAPLMTATYIALLAIALERGWRRVGQVLQASGRMSLSVYLLESIVVSTLAYGYGFGLFGRVGPLAGVAIAIAVWAGLSLLSVGWLRHHRFGPFEWVLRSVTYGRRQTLRRSPVSTRPPGLPGPPVGRGFVGGRDQTGE